MDKPFFVLLAVTGMTGSTLAAPSLTIYNQNFAVVRDTVPLELKAGINRVQVANTTAFLEPDSVVLRDPAGQTPLRILEQNFRSDAATPDRMLKLFEGQTIDFQVQRGDRTEIVRGKIIRAGGALGQNYNRSGYESVLPPLIEVDGKLQFQLPGVPLFPALADGAILRPTLDWQLETSRATKLEAELSYVSARFGWKADYNVIAPENGGLLDLTGWVTLSNSSGKSFEGARIKLMAGDVNKIQPQSNGGFGGGLGGGGRLAADESRPQLTQKSFDDYHLYTLERPADLRDGETKQIEMVRAPAVNSQRIYIYDGFTVDERYNGYGSESIRSDRDYGTKSNPKVWVMREFANTKANGLGFRFPKVGFAFTAATATGKSNSPARTRSTTPHKAKLFALTLAMLLTSSAPAGAPTSKWRTAFILTKASKFVCAIAKPRQSKSASWNIFIAA